MRMARRAIPAAMPTTWSITSAAPASARSPAGAARKGSSMAAARPIPKQLERYIENGCHWFYELPDHVKYYRHANRDYLEWASSFGFIGRPDPIIFQLYLRALAEIPPGGAKAMAPSSRPMRIAQRIATLFRSAARLVSRPSKRVCATDEEFPLHAITQRPMAMYHSWGSQNAWLRQILGRNWLYLNPRARRGTWPCAMATGCMSHRPRAASRCR